MSCCGRHLSQKMMVVLEGADHVKFDMGSVGRMKRMAPKFQVNGDSLGRGMPTRK